MKIVLVIMTGIGFTLGVVFGLLLQLPIDNSLPASHPYLVHDDASFRSRRSLSEADLKLQQQFRDRAQPSTSSEALGAVNGKGSLTVEKQQVAEAGTNPVIGSERGGPRPNNDQIYVPRDDLQRPAEGPRENRLDKQALTDTGPLGRDEEFQAHNTVDWPQENGSPHRGEGTSENKGLNPDNNSFKSVKVISVKLNSHKDRNVIAPVRTDTQDKVMSSSPEDASYLSSIVDGILWTPRLENSCPKPFPPSQVGAWRRKAESLDVVKMEEGCGRMQNRLVTFRDASKACARYRLNTDQIQGEIFSYYLARLLHIPNLPPTVLARVDAVSPKWRTVHLQLSLAQWADSKLVVLTQHIDELSPAHIPTEFRGEGGRLEPTLAGLGSKTQGELCELVQWSDLVVLDYLTANLDRVINNMFNRQWNDQMMANPAHNLEQRPDRSLVFLDNESGLFHGYRLLDKYAGFHRSLLQSLCVFRPSTVEAVKRLHESSNIGDELHTLFASSEALHKHVAAIPEKNVKILQQRLGDVYDQIVRCERLFNR